MNGSDPNPKPVRVPGPASGANVPAKSGAAPAGEATVRIPIAPKPEQAIPEAAPTVAANSPGPLAFETTNPEPVVGKPQLRTPEIKLSAPTPSLKAPALRAPPAAGSVWALRLGMLAGVGLALGLVYWAVAVRFIPVTTEHRDTSMQMTRLSDELEKLRGRWTPAQIAEEKIRYARAREMLFDPGKELSDWQAQVSDQANIHSLQPEVKIAEAKPVQAASEGITAVNAELSVRPNVVLGSTVSPYARLLKFSEALTSTPKRLDLVEISVSGDSNSVNQAQAIVQIYAGEKKL